MTRAPHKAPKEAAEQSKSPGTAGLMPLVVAELRNLAVRCLRHERKGHTLEPTELVNEAYLKLMGNKDEDWQSRTHFFAIAASAVRQVLVDHARKRAAQKRGEGRRLLTLHDTDAIRGSAPLEILDLDDALQELEQLDPRQKQIVELRLFGGLKVEEIASVLKVSPRTVKGDWRAAKAWLVHRMGR